MHVRILYIEGCPHSKSTEDLVRRVATSLAIDHGVESVRVDSQEEAVKLRFLGSPTVQIDGRDIEPSARHRTDYALVCRLYVASGMPAADMIRAALREVS